MNKTITVKRTLHDLCTTAEWYHNDKLICFSIERPWLSNIPFKSCIPPGEYLIKPISTKKHPDSFFLENKDLGVSWSSNTTRTEIEIHIANYVHDVVGCMGPGLELHRKIGKNPMVGRSADAMKMLNELIDGEGWKMRIVQ